MKTKKTKRILAIALTFVLAAGAVCGFSFADKITGSNMPTVIYNGSTGEFTYKNMKGTSSYTGGTSMKNGTANGPDLFPDIKNAYPGDEFTQTIKLKVINPGRGDYNIKLRAATADTACNTLLSQSTLNVKLNDTTVKEKINKSGSSFTGTMGGSSGVSLGVLNELDTERTITVTFTIPTTAGNELQNLTAHLDWIFTAESAGPQLDTENHWAYVIGYPDGTVKPQKNITRAEAATIFFRMLTEESRNAARADALSYLKKNKFKDVKDENSWFYNAVYVLASSNIITGYPDGTFKPNNSITRAEFATIATRFYNLEGKSTTFTDIKNHWAKKYIEAAYGAGWISGYPDNTFKPDNVITRAEVCTIVNNVLGRLTDSKLDVYKTAKKDVSKMFKDAATEKKIKADKRWHVWSDNKDTSQWYYVTIQEATICHDYEIKKDSRYEDERVEKWINLKDNYPWATLEKHSWLIA